MLPDNSAQPDEPVTAAAPLNCKQVPKAEETPLPQDPRLIDAYLVAGVRLGERGAFARLVAWRGPRLYAHARRLCDDADTARDLVQQAWVSIWRGLGGLRDDRAFLPWALRIVTRAAARDLRGRLAARRLAQDWAAVAETEAPAAGEAGAEAAVLHRALAVLSPEHRAVLALFYLEEMRVAEVAIALDIPPGTVKTRLMHARGKLRAYLEGDHDGQV
jgi:RNA polymerase sigma-70 factor (ECF subfamily)